MSISLGQAALAFAGGMAGEYNQQQAEKRQSATRMEERNRELAQMHQYRVAETRFANQLEQDLTLERDQQSIQAAGGMDSPQAALWFAVNKLGFPPEKAVSMMREGWRPDMSRYAKPTSHRDTVREAQEAVEGDPRLTRRFAQMSKTADSYEGIPVETPRFDPSLVQSLDSIWNPAKGPDFKVAGGALAIIPEGATSADDITWSTPPEKPGSVLPQSPEGKKVHDRAQLARQVAANPEDAEAVAMLQMMDDLLDKDESLKNLTVLQGTYRDENGIERTYAQLAERTSEGLQILGDEVLLGERHGREGAGGRAPSSIPTALSPVWEQTARVTTFQNQLTQRMERLSAMDEGAAGALTDLQSFLVTNIRGLAETVGVNRETIQERMSEFSPENRRALEELVTSDRSFMRGENVQDAGMLAYSLAGLLKEDSLTRQTTNADINQAITLIRNLSSSDRGMGAFAKLMYHMDTRKSRNNSMLYMSPEVPASVRMESGYQLLKTVNPNLSDAQIMSDNETGDVYWFRSVAGRQRFNEALQRVPAEVPDDQVMQTVMMFLEPNDRPQELRHTIRENGGVLIPRNDPIRYIGKYAQQ